MCSSRTPSASPWMKNIGALVALSLSAPKSYGFKCHRDDALDEIREFVWRRAQCLVFGFDGRAFECFRRELRERVECFLHQAVVAEHGRNADDLSHFFRMADRTLHRDAAAHAVTDEVRAWDLEIIEHRSHIVGEVFIAEIAIDVGRAPVALHFDGNHFSRFGKFADPVPPGGLQLLVMVMNEPWSNTTGSPLPWTS